MNATILPARRVTTRVAAFGVLERIGRAAVGRALQGLAFGRVEVIDASGRMVGGGGHGPGASVHVSDARVYAEVALHGSVGAAQAYMEGWWRCDDLAALVEVLAVNLSSMRRLDRALAWVMAPARRLDYLFRSNTRSGSKRNIVAHYDLGNEFFGLFLDSTMMYSCAIFDDPSWSLERAQIEKLDRVCRKLQLKPGDEVLEIGTGWGSMAIHAARKYGCRVTTTTISDRQFDYATSRVKEQGLTDRVTVVKRDYRDLSGQYDKVISIEMVEAVGARFLDGYFRTCSGLLKPDGMMLLQSITVRDQLYRGAARRQDFLKKYIFPGSCLPSAERLSTSIRRATDMNVVHLEDIGPHYATTLRLWREAFNAKLDEVRVQGFSETFIRMWEYYLCYCEGTFRARQVGDVQMLMGKPMCRREPYLERAAGGAP